MENITINLGKNSELYFTSDLHFNHDNAIEFCGRPFANRKEMNATLIEKWNERVRPNDFIFNLGDTIWFNSRHETKKYISKLRGRKHFVLGNHDRVKQYDLCNKEQLFIHDDICCLRVNFDKDDERYAEFGAGVTITLSHYPLSCFSGSNHEHHYHLFGHIHSKKGQPMMEFGRPVALNGRKSMDVGVDRHDYAPVSLSEIIKEIREYPFWACHETKPIEAEA